MLDPDRLLEKIENLKAARAAHAHELPSDHRLPDGYFDDLSGAIGEERADPHRVTRATNAAAPDGPPAPPPVIYLSRKPSVSQFMTVISECFEQDLQGPAAQGLLHLGDLAHLERAVERLGQDLLSRFRRFGPCDIRYIEPKLAGLLVDCTGRHPFSRDPAHGHLDDQAEVILVGDWATGLPQARNVAARIRERLAARGSGAECHVIHLGDTYYSGFEAECRHRFLDNWPVDDPAAASSWTLAGNHDMYSGGHGYFEGLLADRRFRAQQGCSYFSLSNDHWQILGLDSSYKDPDVPDLQDPQREWLADQIANAGGRLTILLTHHQPFSAYEAVNGTLANTIVSGLGERRVKAWIWGHEHRCAVYRPRIDAQTDKYVSNADYSAIVGHGGVPQLLSASTGAVDRDALAWEFADYFEAGDDRWGLGGYAVLGFSGATVEIQYYDEYGKAARSGPAKGYPEGGASLDDVRAAPDDRPVRPPDVLGRGRSETASST
jgi:hypothetical protein